MHPHRWIYAVIAALAVAVIALLGWQRQTASALRVEITRQRDESAERARLQTENQRLVAAQPTVEQLEELLARHTALEQLRSQIAAMHRREEEAARVAATQRTAVVERKPAVRSLKGNSLKVEEWQNAGQATPDAAFQTTLWAAAAGDIDALAEVLMFDPEVKGRAAETFSRLPEPLRNDLGTPERLVALMTALDVPLGSASILAEFPTPTETRVSAVLIDPEGNPKTAFFSLRAADGRWRLIVPENVARKYADTLRAPPVAAAGSTN